MSKIRPDELTPEMIRTIRLRLNLNQRMMANRLGTYQKTVSHWESGKHPPNRHYRALLTVMANSELVQAGEEQPNGARE
jgi:DNA-binding transcriptional regulator YiaG